eukprot:TRINITY_DN95150_c0_g1_i1.p1 TRINITY_DN95150_c0_g1~~TRINITY_DN95150_c0_g1_i1.p1  ORF type:complete len:113 (-),score=25.60 TRINITY_DN95150_c0_g1_i1:83-421(-)
MVRMTVALTAMMVLGCAFHSCVADRAGQRHAVVNNAMQKVHSAAPRPDAVSSHDADLDDLDGVQWKHWAEVKEKKSGSIAPQVVTSMCFAAAMGYMVYGNPFANKKAAVHAL